MGDEAKAKSRKELSRELGLPAYFSIGAGNMLGVSVFVIPALAVAHVGPIAFLAYGIALVVALAAALSVSELVTAMPETGGSYRFLDRAMGPMTGTVVGLGTWLISVFKGAFAVFVFGQFLYLAFGLDFRIAGSLLLAALLALNVRGIRQSGGLQIAVVLVVLASLGIFALAGLFSTEPARFSPLVPSSDGYSLLFATAALVVFSYVGLVKITAVAGEVKDPERNIPRGVLLVMVAVTLGHLAVLSVLIGASGSWGSSASLTAVLDVAGPLLGPWGAGLLLLTALVAFASTANTAILFSGRYPYAMAHDGLLPSSLGSLSRRFVTPHVAIVSSGVLMLVLASSLDLETLVEVTSSFALIIFVLLHLAVLILRHASPAWYTPPFRSPGYPWVQGVGIAGGLLLAAFLQPVAQAVILVFIAGGVSWYFLYARRRAKPGGELREAVRRRTLTRAVANTATKVAEGAPAVLLPIDSPDHARDIFQLASWLTGRGGFIRAVRVGTVPFQTPLYDIETAPLAVPQGLRREIAQDAVEFGLGTDFVEILAHDSAQALRQVAGEGEFQLLLLDWDSEIVARLGRRRLKRLLTDPTMGAVLFRDRGLPERRGVLLASDRGPYDELEVGIARGAAEGGGRVTLFRVLPANASSAQEEAVKAYHGQLGEVLSAPIQSRIVRAEDPAWAITREAERHDLLIMRVGREPKFGKSVFGRTVHRVTRKFSGTLILTSQAESRPTRLVKWALHRSLS